MKIINISNEEWLNKAIKAVIAAIVIIVILFVGFYMYFQSRMSTEVPVYDATKALEEAVRKKPLDPEARVRLGYAYLAQERYEEAIKQLKEALKIDEEYQSALIFLGTAYLEQEKFDEALEYFEKEVELYKEAGYATENKWLEEAFFNIAVIKWKQKDYEAAIESIRNALKIKRADADNYFFLGRLLLEQGSHTEAVEPLMRAVAFDPNYSDAHFGLGLAYEGVGEPGRAVYEFQQAYETAEDETLEGDAEKKRDSLLEELEEKAGKSGSKAVDFYNLGYAYIGMGEYDKAIEQFNKAIKKDENYDPAYFGLGFTSEKMGKIEEAMGYYTKAVELNEENLEAKEALSRLEIGVTEDEYIPNM